MKLRIKLIPHHKSVLVLLIIIALSIPTIKSDNLVRTYKISTIGNSLLDKYIIIRNDSLIVIGDDLFYCGCNYLCVRSINRITPMEGNFYTVSTIGGSKFALNNDLLVKEATIEDSDSIGITIDMPNCKYSHLRIGFYPYNKATRIFASRSSCSNEDCDINEYLESHIMTDGHLDIPFYPVENDTCLLSLRFEYAQNSNPDGQYFGLNEFLIEIPITKGMHNFYIFPNIDLDSLRNYYFNNEIVRITDDEIYWMGSIYKYVKEYPKKIDSFLYNVLY